MSSNRTHIKKQRTNTTKTLYREYPVFFAKEESQDMKYEGILSSKQHLNLSRKTYAVLTDDMVSFQIESLSGYLNLIFSNYYEWAESSISRSLDRIRQLEERLVGMGECSETAMNSLLQQEANRLLVKSKSYPKGVGLKFYLNKQNTETIEREFSMEANWYDGHPMRYFRCVIEEYAEKNRLEREEILFRQEIETLTSCAEQHKLVCIETGGKIFEVKPFQVIPDYNGMHYYLAGISRPINSSVEEDKIASFRISRIKKIRPRPKTYRSGRLTAAEQSSIVERLEVDGVQFLISPRITVKIRLTEKGMERFHNQTHLRPHLLSVQKEKDTYICSCDCTETQIRYYFFQFGPEVEIVEPVSLREVFRDKYKEALALYE